MCSNSLFLGPPVRALTRGPVNQSRCLLVSIPDGRLPSVSCWPKTQYSFWYYKRPRLRINRQRANTPRSLAEPNLGFPQPRWLSRNTMVVGLDMASIAPEIRPKWWDATCPTFLDAFWGRWKPSRGLQPTIFGSSGDTDRKTEASLTFQGVCGWQPGCLFGPPGCLRDLTRTNHTTWKPSLRPRLGDGSPLANTKAPMSQLTIGLHPTIPPNPPCPPPDPTRRTPTCRPARPESKRTSHRPRSLIISGLLTLLLAKQI